MQTETNPATAEVSAESRLEAMFEKQGEGTRPEEAEAPDDDLPVDEDERETEPEEETDESTAEAATDESADDAEEVEYEGKAYRLPKELKEALLRQQDYTRKTQEVASQRKAVEQLAEQVRMQTEFQQAHLPKLVEIQSIDAQLKQYAQVNWAELAAENPAQCMTLQMQRNALKEQADGLRGELGRLAHEHGEKATQMRQQAQARCIEEVRKDIKGFDADMLRSIDDTARTFGFSGDELAQVTDPRVVKVLHAAMQYQKLQGSKSIADKKVQEARPVQVRSARSAQPNLQTKQLGDARARLKATGKVDDAVNYLTAKFARQMR